MRFRNNKQFIDLYSKTLISTKAVSLIIFQTVIFSGFFSIMCGETAF